VAQALAVELGEADAVGGVGDVEVKAAHTSVRQLVSPGSGRSPWSGA
jgi:hypothetical protein